MRILTIASMLATLTACASSSGSPTTPSSREVVIAHGATASVASGLSVKFVAVTGDSRCPADAICITGGDAVVKLQLLSSGTPSEVELHTGSQQPVTSNGATFELVQLAPYPFSTRTIDPADYRLTLRVTR